MVQSELLGFEARLKRLDRLATWLDARWIVPGTNFRVGLDGVLGLIPGIGDTMTAALATYIIYEAHHLGAPLHLKLRMAGNILLDWLLGSIPLVGDIFDMAHKANLKNMHLLRRHLNR